jgi:ADP-ribosylglycohydrolase
LICTALSGRSKDDVLFSHEHMAFQSTKVQSIAAGEYRRKSTAAISGSGYVIHCLESSLWCAAQAASYLEGVLRAVNLGDDTDTTGAVTGGLLGLRFGKSAIPSEWVEQLARRNDILALCDRFQEVCQRKWETDR